MYLPLVRDLLHSHSIYSVGTLNRLRKYIPKEITGKNETKMMKRGESRFRFWAGKPPLQVSCWQDSKLVCLISNHPEITDAISVTGRYDQEKKEILEIPRPVAYENYSAYMFGKSLVCVSFP
jgi:hypothetical protein